MLHGRMHIQGALFIQNLVIVPNVRTNKSGNHCIMIVSCIKRMGIKKHPSLLLLFTSSGQRQIIAMSFLTANIQLSLLVCHSHSINSVSSQLSINLFFCAPFSFNPLTGNVETGTRIFIFLLSTGLKKQLKRYQSFHLNQSFAHHYITRVDPVCKW